MPEAPGHEPDLQRVSDEEARAVVRLWADRQAQHAPQAPDPRPTVADLAAGLDIAPEEAASLLEEVRRQREIEERNRKAALAQQKAEERRRAVEDARRALERRREREARRDERRVRMLDQPPTDGPLRWRLTTGAVVAFCVLFASIFRTVRDADKVFVATPPAPPAQFAPVTPPPARTQTIIRQPIIIQRPVFMTPAPPIVRMPGMLGPRTFDPLEEVRRVNELNASAARARAERLNEQLQEQRLRLQTGYGASDSVAQPPAAGPTTPEQP